MPKFWTWISAKYGRVLIMQALHNVLIMSEYALKEFWIYLRLHNVPIMPEYALKELWIYLRF